MAAITFAVLAIAPFIGVFAQLQTCSDGGVGPCLNGGCPSTTQKCINTTAGEICCEVSKIINGVVTTTASSLSSLTTTSACVDRVDPKTGKSDCTKLAYLCADGRYYAVMNIQCPKTCGRCGANGSTLPPVVIPTGCQDKVDLSTGTSNCLAVSSYCNNPVYKDLMRQQCPKTCGFCQ